MRHIIAQNLPLERRDILAEHFQKTAHPLPPPAGEERWRRWFSGPARHHEPGMPIAAQLAVVVIGFRAQPGLVDAVASLLSQDIVPEIVVVNSGGGGAAGLLGRFAERIRIIDIEQPLRVGAARNIGIDASMAPYVAFLAGDCRARPGWVGARLKLHEKGARAVASAIAVPEHSALAIAAHLTLFGLRSPQVHAAQALRYGVSYAREVFGAHGYFNTAMRIAEDSMFSRRLGRRVFPAWAPQVQTEHKNPRTLPGLARDMFGRGVRAARRDGSGWGKVPAQARQRYEAAFLIGRDMVRLDKRQLRKARPFLALASLAYALGLAHGAARLRRAKQHAERAGARSGKAAGTRAIRLLEKAVELDPENVWFRLLCADAQLSQGSPQAQAHIERAMELSAYHPEHAGKLMAWLEERQLADAAGRLANLLAYTLPSS